MASDAPEKGEATDELLSVATFWDCEKCKEESALDDGAHVLNIDKRHDQDYACSAAELAAARCTWDAPVPSFAGRGRAMHVWSFPDRNNCASMAVFGRKTPVHRHRAHSMDEIKLLSGDNVHTTDRQMEPISVFCPRKAPQARRNRDQDPIGLDAFAMVSFQRRGKDAAFH